MDFPHTRGDEPLGAGIVDFILHIFPTRVGMNRW